ncbi:Macrocin-O-methyltransferase [Candidatus Magnetomorum sp. HK-1]|nr:Macrocin-O-methyltransferase [Candidatus Magnetomorum sp. HK-1]
MKFLQILTFYEKYLIDFYTYNKQIVNYSYKDQLNELIRDGFGASHIFAPYLNDLGYDSHLVIANNSPAQLQWAKENNIHHENKQEILIDIVKKQVDLIKPDILYFTDPVTFDDSFINTLNHRPNLIIGWRAATFLQNTKLSKFDIILSNAEIFRQKSFELGAKSFEFFFPGFPDFISNIVKNESPKLDIVFSGNVSGEHRNRLEYLKIITNYSNKRSNLSTAFFIPELHPNSLPLNIQKLNNGPCWGINMYRALKCGRIVLNIDIDFGDGGNMRLFETTGVGSFLLTQYQDKVAKYFEPGKEVETFRSPEEMIEKIEYYLKYPQKREDIAYRGQQKCLSEFSIKNRAIDFDNIIRKYMSKKRNSKLLNQKTVSDLKKKSMTYIDNNNFEKAFEIIIQAKALKIPTYNLDYMKAICFVRMNRPFDAIESLREELRFFPENVEAKKLLVQLSEDFLPPKEYKYRNYEFSSILKKIKPNTMLSEERLFSLFVLSRHICLIDLPGNFVECGVAAGGSSALIAYVIKKYSKRLRHLYSFDSFEGMPEPSKEDTLYNGAEAQKIGWGAGTCAASIQYVSSFWENLNLSDIIIPVKGYFNKKLSEKKNEIGQISFMHLDGDWYESTKTILENFYSNIAEGGALQVDDYGHWSGCQKAIHEFELQNEISFNINKIDSTGIWFFKKS